MGNKKINQKYTFNVGKFFPAYLLWIVGIIINVIPMVFVTLNEWLKTEPGASFDFFHILISDIEFMYVFCSTAFIFLLELYFVRKTNSLLSKILTGITLLYVTPQFIMYTISHFNENWFTHVSAEFVSSFNTVSFIMLFLIGTLYFIYISTDKKQIIVEA